MARAKANNEAHMKPIWDRCRGSATYTQELPPAKEVAEIEAGSYNGQLISILDECVPMCVCVCVCVCDDCNRNGNRFRNVLRPSVRGDVTTLRSQRIGNDTDYPRLLWLPCTDLRSTHLVGIV